MVWSHWCPVRIVFLLYLLGVLRFDGRVVPRASIVTAPNEGAACIRIVRTGRHCFAFAARPLALITYGLIGWLLILVRLNSWHVKICSHQLAHCQRIDTPMSMVKVLTSL